MTGRRRFLLASGGLLAAPLAARAQPVTRVRRIGVLSAYPEPNVNKWLREHLGAALRRTGYDAGKNLGINWRLSLPLGAPLDDAAAALVRDKIDLIVAFTNHELLAARRATATLPIVMMFSVAPVELGVAKSLARPGGNVTGTLWSSPETMAKTLQLLKEAKPTIARIAVLRNPDHPGHSHYASAVASAAAALGLRHEFFSATRPTAIGPALDQIATHRPDALLVISDAVISDARVGQFATAHKLVSIATAGSFPLFHGGLFSYAPDSEQIVERTVNYIDRILRGVRPAELPIELPSRFLFVVNAKTARAIGFTVPQSLLLRADHVIE